MTTSTASTDATPGPRATVREWAGLGVLGLALLLISLDFSVLYLALPHLGADLGASSTQLLWITDIYGFVIAGLLVTMGGLGDRIGRRRLLLIGATGFGVASVLAAYSISPEMLIVSRGLLGVAGATLMPSTLALIRNMFLDPRQRAFAIAFWMTSFSVGAVLGPLVGGVMLEFFWWGAVFLLGAPVMLVLLIAGPVLLPEYRDPSAGRLELRSAAYSLLAVLPLIYGLKRLADDGASPEAGLALLVGVVFLVAFVRRQRRVADPMLDLSLFANRAFGVSAVAMVVGFVAFAGTHFFAVQYLQLVLGLSPLQAGLWMIPTAIVDVIAVMGAPVLTRWIRPGFVVAGGLAVTVVGLAVLTQVQAGSGVLVVVAGMGIVVFGFGPLNALGTDLIVGSAPENRAGAASAVGETGGEFGQAMGIAFLGSLGGLLYTRQLAEQVPPSTLPDGSGKAYETLANALAMVPDLPAPIGGDLAEAARESFTLGLNAGAGVAGVLLAGLAVAVAILLRNVRG